MVESQHAVNNQAATLVRIFRLVVKAYALKLVVWMKVNAVDRPLSHPHRIVKDL